ncbi:MAG: PglZ domain-containing protein [Candidatus Marinimicrobia bacterium]|nr:PglZ domain-containing protein [Candidatus Neomarinimicrobiota bacterium]MBT5069976.1 PglZ domain-containing protein [Candidatus Neomarinimicrobiota bacterium]
MNKPRAHILWVDDEIDHLKPHILFLEEKGYTLTTATNGRDAVLLAENTFFDLILLDQTMPGMDGLETLKQIKSVRPDTKTIMITKSEDEWLMDAAISEYIAQLLIKPVNPNQILMACKQVLEQSKIQEEKATTDYLKVFQKISQKLHNELTIDEWWDLYNELVTWQLKFDEHRDTGLGDILKEQLQSCNREFVHFIEKHYTSWLNSEEKPTLSPQFYKSFIKPEIDNDQKVCFIVVDCMRHDQLMAIMPDIKKYFNVSMDYQLSLLPTATPYSRNAIFCGLYPDEMIKKYPEQGKMMKEHAPSLNQLEKIFFEDLLGRSGNGHKSFHYHKIWAVGEGKKFKNRIQDYLKQDILAIVVNFVDILAHKSSQLDVLKEMVPDESGYRTAVKTWFESSWLFHVLKVLAESDYKVIITSDHGSIRVQRDVMVAADRDTSSGVRYKYGRNLNTKSRNALVIKDPSQYRLPSFGEQPSYIMAKDDIYFVYPNQVHKFQSMYSNSFQHGGISMEEMLVPVATLIGK